MQATKANLKRCGATSVMFCTECHSKYSATAGDYWDYEDDHVFVCGACKSEMVLGSFVKIFIPDSPIVICVIHDQEDYISTWLVEAEPGEDPLEAIHKELFKDDEDWDTLKDSIEWFYLDSMVATDLKEIEWPETFRDDQTFEHETVKATIYRAFKVGGSEDEDPKEG